MKKILLLIVFVSIGISSFAQFGSLVKSRNNTSETQNINVSRPAAIEKKEPVKDESYYYDRVKETMKRTGGFHPLVKDDISKAIELNPTNTEYRWIRARANLNTHSKEAEFNQAIDDLNKMVELGDGTGKVYGFLGIAYEELGKDIVVGKKAQKNEGFSDDNSVYVKEQIGYYQEAINAFEKSKEANIKASEVDPDKFKDNLHYKLKELDDQISTVKQKIEKLK